MGCDYFRCDCCFDIFPDWSSCTCSNDLEHDPGYDSKFYGFEQNCCTSVFCENCSPSRQYKIKGGSTVCDRCTPILGLWEPSDSYILKYILEKKLKESKEDLVDELVREAIGSDGEEDEESGYDDDDT